MIPYPQSVSYAARSAPPSYSEQRKFESTYSIYPVIPPSFSLLTSALSPFGFCTSRSCQGNIIALIVAGLPLSTTAPLFQRIDPEALRLGPITICGECLRTILRGVIIASPTGCFSHARLQYLIRIVENRAGYISLLLFVEDPGFPPTLAHW